MAQTDPEDGFDQIMVQSWNSVAQQLRTLHNELSGDRARRRERAERAVQNERYEQTRRQQQSIRLEQWEMDNRERLNKGFESTLNATVLADGDGWRIPSTPATAHIALEVKSLYDGTVTEVDEDIPFQVDGTIRFLDDGSASISITSPDQTPGHD